MLILKCDKCHSEIPDNNDAIVVCCVPYNQRMTCRPTEYELCKSCGEALTNWLNLEEKQSC